MSRFSNGQCSQFPPVQNLLFDRRLRLFGPDRKVFAMPLHAKRDEHASMQRTRQHSPWLNVRTCPQMYMRSVLRSSEATLEAADGVFASPEGSAVPKDVGLARFYRLRSLRCGKLVQDFSTYSGRQHGGARGFQWSVPIGAFSGGEVPSTGGTYLLQA